MGSFGHSRAIRLAAVTLVMAQVGCDAFQITGPFDGPVVLGRGAHTGAQGNDPFEFLWGVRTNVVYERQTGRDLASEINLSQSAFQRDAVRILYDHEVGKFPVGGPHLIRMYPNWLDQHKQKVMDDIAALYPDPNEDSIVVVDYERWEPVWSLTKDVPSTGAFDAFDNDFKSDWIEYHLSKNPSVFAGMNPSEKEQFLEGTYNLVCKEFFLSTIDAIHLIRPNIRVSFWNFPHNMYYNNLTPSGVIGYGNLAHNASVINSDELGWLYEAMDVLVPAIYANHRTIPQGQPRNNWDNWPEHEDKYVRTIVQEALRLADGKPVYPCSWWYYHAEYSLGPLKDLFLTDLNVEKQFRVPAEEGAHGVILWAGVKSPEEKDRCQQYLNAVMGPKSLDVKQAFSPVPTGGSSSTTGSGQSSSGGNTQPPQSNVQTVGASPTGSAPGGVIATGGTPVQGGTPLGSAALPSTTPPIVMSNAGNQSPAAAGLSQSASATVVSQTGATSSVSQASPEISSSSPVSSTSTTPDAGNSVSTSGTTGTSGAVANYSGSRSGAGSLSRGGSGGTSSSSNSSSTNPLWQTTSGNTGTGPVARMLTLFGDNNAFAAGQRTNDPRAEAIEQRPDHQQQASHRLANSRFVIPGAHAVRSRRLVARHQTTEIQQSISRRVYDRLTVENLHRGDSSDGTKTVTEVSLDGSN